MIRQLLDVGFALAILLALSSNVGAVAVQGVARNIPYVIGFHALHSSQHPYVGQMRLNFNNGIISGTYTDISVKPGSPFANGHNIPVSGGVTNSNVTLKIRQVSFKGTIHGNKMSGSATIRGTIYQWTAQQGTPGNGG